MLERTWMRNLTEFKLSDYPEIDLLAYLCATELNAHIGFGTLSNTSGRALREAESALEEARAEPDPLAVHIFASRRHYSKMPDTKSGKRGETTARLSWQTACTLGYCGSLEEWRGFWVPAQAITTQPE